MTFYLIILSNTIVVNKRNKVFSWQRSYFVIFTCPAAWPSDIFTELGNLGSGIFFFKRENENTGNEGMIAGYELGELPVPPSWPSDIFIELGELPVPLRDPVTSYQARGSIYHDLRDGVEWRGQTELSWVFIEMMTKADRTLLIARFLRIFIIRIRALWVFISSF